MLVSSLLKMVGTVLSIFVLFVAINAEELGWKKSGVAWSQNGIEQCKTACYQMEGSIEMKGTDKEFEIEIEERGKSVLFLELAIIRIN